MDSAVAYTYQGGWNDGQYANRHEYDVWGYNSKSPTYNYDPMYRSAEPYFTGHQFDGSLNIYYADARFYDAETGTWLSPDPVKDGLNWYSYCGNNPTTNVDPTGLRLKTLKEPTTVQMQYKVPETQEAGEPNGSESLTMSSKGVDLLKYYENSSSVLKKWGLGVYNGSDLIGIYPHYVFTRKEKADQWKSDGGITLGFGHYVSKAEYVTDPTEKALIDKYAKDAPLIPSTVPDNGASYIVPDSIYMPIQDVENLLRADITTHEQQLSKIVREYGFDITQEQFDVLVIIRYHKYRLGDDIDVLLDKNDYDKLHWEHAIKDLIGTGSRTDALINLFNNGIYPDGI